MVRINSFSTDTGILGDGITSDNTLTLTGTAAASSTVSLYDGTTLLGTATADTNGAWNYTTSTLQDGTHNFTASTTSTSSTSSGFPDASTTGVSAGTSLTTVSVDDVGNFNSSQAGQVIEGINVPGTLVIDDPGVIVRNCQAQYIYVTADNVTIEDSTVTGQNSGGSGIVLLGRNATVQRVDISGVENGIWLEANGCLIQDNYIHGLRNDGNSDPHYDGLQIPGGNGVSNNLITHNNFDLAFDVSSSITMSDATNIDITNNRLHGGTYTIYFEGNSSGCDVTNNVFAAHVYGDWAGASADAQTFSGNVFGDTAASISTASTTTTETSPPLAVTIDTTPPSGDGTGGGTGGDTGGGLPDDGSTTSSIEFTSVRQKLNDKVVFQGTAEAGDHIAIHDTDGTVVGGATAGEDDTFTLTTSRALPDNVVHNFTTTITNSAGQNVPTSGSVVLGTSGDDHITGTSGNDLFRGNGGHDTFEFEANFGRDLISDFHATRRGHDIVEFRDASFHNFADVMAHASQHGQDVVIDDGAGNSLTLTNTVLSNLDRTDFHFA